MQDFVQKFSGVRLLSSHILGVGSFLNHTLPVF